MEVEDVTKIEGLTALPHPTPSVIAIAISGSKKSKHILRWALENFLPQPQEDVCFKLLHVYPEITAVPTPLGASIPISQVRDDVATAFRKEVEWRISKKIIPYKMMFIRRKVQVDLVQIEANDVANAIAKEVAKCNIKKLVIGASSTGIFSRGHNWSSKISGVAPSFCTVYVVSKGKLSSVRPVGSGTSQMSIDDRSDTSSTSNSLSHSTSPKTEEWTDCCSNSTYSSQYPPSLMHQFQVPSTTEQTLQSLLDKRTSPSESIEPKSSDHDIQEGDDDFRSFISSSEINDTESHTSYPYAPSPLRPMQLFEGVSTKIQNPVPRSTCSSGKVYPRDMSSTAEREDVASYNRRSKDFNASYVQSLFSHVHSSPSSSQRFPALSTKIPTSSHKSIYSSADIKPIHKGGSDSTASLSSSNVDTANSRASFSHFPYPPPVQQLQALSLKDQALHQSPQSSGTTHPIYMPRGIGDGKDEVSTRTKSHAFTFRSSGTENHSISWTTDPASTSGAPTDFSSGSQVNINFELEKLRMELRHTQGLYSIAQSKLNALKKRRLEEAIKHKEIKLKEEAKEKQKHEAAKRAANYAKEFAEKEAEQRIKEEATAPNDVEENEKLDNATVTPAHQYLVYSWEEIVSATDSFSDNHRVGMGAYGTVYKCSLHHTTAAVKVLHSSAAHRTKHFQQEIEMLSKIHHPHLLALLGTCPEHGWLVYEYMENGSLEDRLLRKNNTLPLPWFERYRIAQEVASALAFLHSSKPKPIVHQNLKPANILLDHNLVSKIGDVGLSTVVHPASADQYTIYKDKDPVGTLSYIDPEYQRTGTVSPDSDVYALGMVILQLLTAKPAVALAQRVEEAVEDDKLTKVLDPEAGEWPLEETRELALLALKCTEICRKDRPDLKDHILPTLEKLRTVASRVHDLGSNVPTQKPSHFIHPLLKDAMKDRCLPADGYTNDHKAIEAWIENNDTSPVTKAPLPHKLLLPSYTSFSIHGMEIRKH